MSSFPDAVSQAESSVGTVRFRLEAPHAGLADYRRQNRLLILSHVRQWKYAVVGLLIGMPIGLAILLAAVYWRFWAEGTLELGLDRTGSSMLLQGRSFWIILAALFIAGVILGKVDSITVYRLLTRKMHATSAQAASQASLLIGDDGLQTIQNDIELTIPWAAVCRFHIGSTASFVLFNHNLASITIAHDSFASTNERAECLAFLQSRVPKS